MPSIAVLLLSAVVARAAVLEDRNQFCSDWAAKGECTTNAAYMLDQCAHSCAALSQAALEPPQAPELPLAAAPKTVDAEAPQALEPRPPEGSAGAASAASESCVAEREEAAEECGRQCAAEREEATEECRQATAELERRHRASIDKMEREAQDDLQHQRERTEAVAERLRAEERRRQDCFSRMAADRARLVKQTEERVGREFQEAHKELLHKALREVAKAADKREWREKELARAARQRAEAAEAKLAGIVSGSDRRDAERRAENLAKEAAAAERASIKVLAQHQQQMQLAAARESELRAALEAAEAEIRALRAELSGAAACGERPERVAEGMCAAAPQHGGNRTPAGSSRRRTAASRPEQEAGGRELGTAWLEAPASAALGPEALPAGSRAEATAAVPSPAPLAPELGRASGTSWASSLATWGDALRAAVVRHGISKVALQGLSS